MAVQFNPFTGNLDLVEANAYSALNLLGTVANAAALPGGATAGDVYQAEDTGIFYVWDGAAWDNLGTLVGPQGPKGDTGDAGPAGPAGTNGINGTNGVGVVAGGTTGQALVKASNTDYDTQWSDVTAVAALNDLTDVVINTPSDGQVLEYDSATSQWINATPTGGGGTPGGTTGQLQWNSAGSFAGVGGSTVGATGDITLSLNGAASTPPLKLTGTWFVGANSKPHVLIEPTGTTSTAWSTSGTGLGVNAASGFAGNLLDLQVNGASKVKVGVTGSISLPGDGTTVTSSNWTGLNGSNRATPDGGVALRAGAFYLGSNVTFGWSSNTNPINHGPDIAFKRDQANVAVITDGSTGTGYLKQTPVAVSALPNAATVGAGTRGFVSDATSTTFGTTVTGGGSNNVPVFSDGNNWLIG